jgi:hypothetical protein
MRIRRVAKAVVERANLAHKTPQSPAMGLADLFNMARGARHQSLHLRRGGRRVFSQARWDICGTECWDHGIPLI